MDIKPGSTVQIKVKRTIVSQAAAKTLSRLFAKDPVNKKARRWRKKLLKGSMEVRRRGGRPWEVRQKAPRLFQPVTGDACKVLATPDVIGDILSVERYIDIAAAK